MAIENKFKEGTLGNEALKMLVAVKDSETGALTHLLVEKNDTVKAVLAMASNRGANLSVSAEVQDKVKSIGIEEAIAAYMQGEGQVANPLQGQVIVDFIKVLYGSTTVATINVAAMKAVSCNMKFLTEGVLSSTRVVCQCNNVQTNNKASIRDQMHRSNLPLFGKIESDSSADTVVKRQDIKNLQIASMLDWNDLYDYDTLNALIASARADLERASIAAYRDYGRKNPADEKMYITALRLQNRSLLDSIFNEAWETMYEPVDLANAGMVQRYLSYQRMFHARFSAIGQGYNIAPYTCHMGIQRLDVVTSLKQDVSSLKRVGKVKRNAVNSFFHLKPQDTGIYTGVFASEDLRDDFTKNHFKWVETAGIWLQNESYHFLGLDDMITDIGDELLAEIESAEKPDDITTAELLGFTDPEEVSKLKDEFIKRSYEVANAVITDQEKLIDRETIETLDNIYTYKDKE